MFVVAPVANLSGSNDFDPLQVTDLVASELACVQGFSVVPVNLVLAALNEAGRTQIETPDEAVALARDFHADFAVVTAVTEYDPYEPPVVGLVMQWYPASPPRSANNLDPTAASRQAVALSAELSARPELHAFLQVQRVLNAADQSVLQELRAFARDRTGQQSPSDWRYYLRSQRHYLRFSIASVIRTMKLTHEQSIRTSHVTKAEQL